MQSMFGLILLGGLMTIRDMQKVLDAQFLYGEELADLDAQFVFSADMMSDVLGILREMFRTHHRSLQSAGRTHG